MRHSDVRFWVDTCRCGAVQRWQAADRLERCDECNAPLADAPSVAVGKEIRDGLAFLIGLLDPVEMREAALLTGQEERRLAAARRAGHLATRVCLRANRLLPTLDRKEIEALNALLMGRVGPEAASHRLGLPQYAMFLLAAEDLIRFADHPYVVAHYGPAQIDEAELARFLDRLRARAARVRLEDPVRLRKAARAIGGGAKPWGAIVKALVSGEIPFVMDGVSIAEMTVSRRDAARIGTLGICSEGELPIRCVSQRDALEILNLPLRHAGLLSEASRKGVSLGLPIGEVLDVARSRVTLAELCAWTGIHGTRLEAMLEGDGCPRRDPMGWSRADATEWMRRFRRSAMIPRSPPTRSGAGPH